MNRKELKEKYHIFGNNNNLSLYRKQGEYTYGIGYCGNIILRHSKAIFNGIVHKSIEELDKALVEWEKSLPFPVDTYNPNLNEKDRIGSQISFYLTKIGFKSTFSNYSEIFIKKIGISFEISIELSTKFDKLLIVSKYGDFTFCEEINDTEEGIKIINTLVNGEILVMAKDMLDAISSCGESVTNEIDTFIKTNENIFGYQKVSFKDVMITRLENVLSQLKSF